MQKIYFIGCFFLFAFANEVFAQYEHGNLEKYWYYRYRLINNLLIITAFILMVLMPSCGKKAVKINPDYVGSWHTDKDKNGIYQCSESAWEFTSSIEIDNKSRGKFHESDCNSEECSSYGEGIFRIKRGKLKLAITFKGNWSKKTWIIDQEPMEHDTVVCPNGFGNARWTMVLSGITYYK